jgi:SAM-dependent methyltransferase
MGMGATELLRSLTVREIHTLHRQTHIQLSQYKPPFIERAPEKIAQKMNYMGIRQLEEQYHRVLDIEQLGSTPPQLRKLVYETAVALNPGDLMRNMIEYVAIDITLKLLYSNLKGLNVLQLACNYGPYLHFLKHEEGIRVFGVDIAQAAAKYANENGIDVIRASAMALPFRSDEFDVVFSKNFLSSGYLRRLSHEDLIIPAAKEIHRVLKPGGIYLSDYEDFYLPDFGNIESLPPPLRYPPGTPDVLSKIVIFEK